MTSREVVTLQIGHYSNFVGTHWWNLQESSFVYDPNILKEFPKEVNHDVLFREGKTLKGEVTYTPRLVLFDLNNSLGSLKKEGTLYDVGSEEDVRWMGDVTLHKTPSARKNRFLQDLDNEQKFDKKTDDGIGELSTDDNDEKFDVNKPATCIKSEDEIFRPRYNNLDIDVQVWSDFLRTGLHPRSVFLLKDFHHGSFEQPFNVFGMGQQVGRDMEQWDVIEDKIRYFVEECDCLQGFHILLDSHNAFGGLASVVLAYLLDEFSSKSRLSLAVTPACPPDQIAGDRSARILNSALNLYYNTNQSSLYVPLSLASALWKNVGPPLQIPHLQYNASLDYHTSAILAATLDTMTMPYRKESDAITMTDIISCVSALNRKVAALSTCLPLPLRSEGTFAECLLGYGQTNPWVSLTPHVKCISSPLFNSCVVRGVPPSMVKCELHPGTFPWPLSSCRSVEEVLQLYLAETYTDSQTLVHAMKEGLKVSAPFPHIFSRNINHQGLCTDSLSDVQTVAAMTSLQSSGDVLSYVNSLEECVSKFNIARHQHFIEAGLEVDEFVEIIEGLRNLAQCYRTQ